MDGLRRLNRWTFSTLVERDPRTKSEVARDAEAAPSTITGLLSGRRDASAELIDRLADVFGEDRRVLLCDPYGLVPHLERVVNRAIELAPHLNGHDFGLRDALDDLEDAYRRVEEAGW